jgi:hypothetical protein
MIRYNLKIGKNSKKGFVELVGINLEVWTLKKKSWTMFWN